MRIGLISPYWGKNLGDCAIIESARNHLARLLPNCHIVLIVLDAEYASSLHGTEAFPITLTPRPFYFDPALLDRGERAIPGGAGAAASQLSTGRLIKTVAGRIPLLKHAITGLRDRAEMIACEERHTSQAFHAVCGLDGLIIAGGGQLDDEYGGPWGHPYSLFKWVTLARTAGRPLFLAGVGVDELHHRLSRWFLRHVLSYARRISVRDTGSFDILCNWGFEHKLALCPDLAFGLYTERKSESANAFSASSLTIGLSPISFGLKGSWPTSHPYEFEHYRHEIGILALSILKRKLSVRIFITDPADERPARALYHQLLSAGADRECIQLFPLLSLDELTRLMKKCDLIVASRLHGVLLSHVSGVPTLAISYRRKVRVHMEDMEQGRFCLDLATFKASVAMEKVLSILALRQEIAADLRARCAEKRSAVERDFAAVAKHYAESV